jgi:hypothetical protein
MRYMIDDLYDVLWEVEGNQGRLLGVRYGKSTVMATANLD